MSSFTVFNTEGWHVKLDDISCIKIGTQIFIPNNISDYALTTKPTQVSTTQSDRTQKKIRV